MIETTTASWGSAMLALPTAPAARVFLCAPPSVSIVTPDAFTTRLDQRWMSSAFQMGKAYFDTTIEGTLCHYSHLTVFV